MLHDTETQAQQDFEQDGMLRIVLAQRRPDPRLLVETMFYAWGPKFCPLPHARTIESQGERKVEIEPIVQHRRYVVRPKCFSDTFYWMEQILGRKKILPRPWGSVWFFPRRVIFFRILGLVLSGCSIYVFASSKVLI